MTVRMTDFQDDSYAFGRSYLVAGRWEGQNASYRHNTFRSPHGMVDIYEQDGRHAMTSMRFIHNGVDHSRRWNRSWGEKTQARLAREFVEDIIR